MLFAKESSSLGAQFWVSIIILRQRASDISIHTYQPQYHFPIQVQSCLYETFILSKLVKINSS